MTARARVLSAASAGERALRNPPARVLFRDTAGTSAAAKSLNINRLQADVAGGGIADIEPAARPRR